MIEILFAFVAGILTVGAPCILPLLPILLGTSIGQQSKWRPVFITLGFVITFSALGVLFSVFTHILGISQNTLRIIAVISLAIFAIFMIWPTPFELFTNKFIGRFINKAYEAGDKYGTATNLGGFIIGITLGIVWTPCAGPVLASILTLIATSKEISKAIILLLAYSAGAGIPMLIVAFGGQWASKQIKGIAPYTKRIQQIFGIMILLLAVAIFFQYDVIIQARLTKYFPTQKLEQKLAHKNNITSDSIHAHQNLTSQNPAPEFSGITKWFNTDPLIMNNLKGKVVLIDFWTYSCINCIRTLPYIKAWHNEYKDKGLIIVGVHTPEFAFEKDPDNVARAIKVDGITYAVAMDNNYLTWNAYQNNAWPAHYLINQNGDIVYTHIGEGAYMETENKIRLLLGLDEKKKSEKVDKQEVKSPEMYFGLLRLANITPSQNPFKGQTEFKIPNELSLNNFALDGSWQFKDEYVKLTGKSGKIQLRFSSAKVYLVAKSSDKPIRAQVKIDGKIVKSLSISESKLYTLYDSNNYGEHFLEVEFMDSGVELFTFTFG